MAAVKIDQGEVLYQLSHFFQEQTLEKLARESKFMALYEI
jgi:hypothetical protein